MSQGIAKKMCFNKRRYPSQFLADKGIETIQKYNPEKAFIKLRSYSCPICCGFHITSARPETPAEKFAKLKHKKV